MKIVKFSLVKKIPRLFVTKYDKKIFCITLFSKNATSRVLGITYEYLGL